VLCNAPLLGHKSRVALEELKIPGKALYISIYFLHLKKIVSKVGGDEKC